MIGIYKITSPTNIIYIGQSINIESRITGYKRMLNKNKSQIKLHNSFLKYKVSNHNFEILEECKTEELNIKERYWQDYYDVLNKGLNCMLTETDILPRIISEETRIKISIATKGKTRSEDSIIKTKTFHTGSKRSDASKLKMSISAIGKIISEETKLKMSISRQKRIISKETCDKISKSNKGKIFSDIHRENISKSTKGRKANNGIKVLDISTNNVYNSIKLASDAINISRKLLSRYLNGTLTNKTNMVYYGCN